MSGVLTGAMGRMASLVQAMKMLEAYYIHASYPRAPDPGLAD
jgi:hypothetical protein